MLQDSRGMITLILPLVRNENIDEQLARIVPPMICLDSFPPPQLKNVSVRWRCDTCLLVLISVFKQNRIYTGKRHRMAQPLEIHQRTNTM